jgi:hypothetical protein
VIESSVEHPHRRRLPCPVGPEEAEDLARLDAQVDAAHRFNDSGPALVVLDQLLCLYGYAVVHALLLVRAVDDQ